MNTRSIRLKISAWAFVGLSSFLVSSILILIVSSFASAASQTKGLPETQLSEFAQNDILFYDPGECIINGGSGSICGDTARAKYWSAVSQYMDDPIHIAGVLGNMYTEGNYNPVAWQGYVGIDTSGNFAVPWDTLYNHSYNGNGDDNVVGVGSVGITWDLSVYLHYVNDNAPDLLEKYFQNPVEYSFNYMYTEPSWAYNDTDGTYGDELLAKIGAAEFDRLVELEVKYAMENQKPSTVESYINQSFSTPSEAASWWATYYEVGVDYQNPSATRLQNAEKAYDDFKDFSCSSSSSSSSASSSSSVSSSSGSSSTVPSDQITWIGDSGSALAHDENWNLLVPMEFPDADFGLAYGDQKAFNTASSYVQSCKFVSTTGCGTDQPNRPGLEILELIIEKNLLRPYLVFDLGSNGGWSDSDMETFLDLVGDDTKIIFVATGYDGDEYWGGINKKLRETADAHPNIYVADMAANYKDEYFDDIEFSVEGSKVFIQTIKDTLNTAANGGCTTFTGDYPEYLQGDSRWGGLPYGSGCTISSCGCGAAAMAMIATVASGQDVFPNDIANLLGDLYYYEHPGTGMEELDKKVCEKYGCEVEMVPYSPGESGLEDKLRKYLKEGYMIHTSGGCSPGDHSSTCPYSYGGHYIAVLALKDDDTAIVGEPGWDGITEYKLSDIAAGLRAQAFSAVRGNGSGGGQCNNYCDDDSSSPTLTGLTEDQAQKLADYYNSSAVDASTLVLGRKDNCVSFTVWFVNEFTNLTAYIDNGKEVAHGLAVQNNLEEGTEPRPFSVFSVTSIGTTVCEDGYICGHTGIVVAVDGDTITTVEAAYGSYDGTVFTVNKSSFSNSKYNNAYTYIDSAIDTEKLKSIVGN